MTGGIRRRLARLEAAAAHSEPEGPALETIVHWLHVCRDRARARFKLALRAGGAPVEELSFEERRVLESPPVMPRIRMPEEEALLIAQAVESLPPRPPAPWRPDVEITRLTEGVTPQAVEAAVAETGEALGVSRDDVLRALGPESD